MKKSIGVCGYYNCKIINGQTLKTQTFTEALQKKVGNQNVETLDYSNWKRSPFKILYSFLKMLRENQFVFVFPDERAFRFIIPLGFLCSRIWKTKFYYAVVGGWLPDFCHKHVVLPFILKRITGVLVETSAMKCSLNAMRFTNVFIMRNFKNCGMKFMPIKTNQSYLNTFYLARIEEKKGILDLIDVVESLNREHRKSIIHLDVYGSIHEEFSDVFRERIQHASESIRYMGVLDSNSILDTICNYDLQVLPTRYRTEGLPGSVLDSYYAGVPMLVSSWNSANEFILDGQTGTIFELGNIEDLKNRLENLAINRDSLSSMRNNCIKMADRFNSDYIISNLLQEIHWSN